MVGVALGLALVVGWVLGKGADAVQSQREFSRTGRLVLISSGIFFSQAISVVPIWWAARRWMINGRRLGYAKPKSWGQALGFAIGTYIAYAICAGIYLVATGVDPENQPEHSIVTILKGDPPTLPVVILLLAGVVVAPIVEELIFRGFLMRQLTELVGPVGGVVMSSVIFGAVHLGSIPLVLVVPYMMLGGVLGAVAWYADSLRPAMAIHTTQNALAMGIASGFGGMTVVLIAAAVGFQFLVFELLDSRLPRWLDQFPVRPLSLRP